MVFCFYLYDVYKNYLLFLLLSVFHMIRKELISVIKYCLHVVINLMFTQLGPLIRLK